MMTRISTVVLALGLAAGCNKPADTGSGVKPTGSAASTKAAMAPASSAPAKKVEGEDLAKAVLACQDKFNAHDTTGACYTDDIKEHFVDSGMPDTTGKAAAIAADQVFTKAFSDLKGQPQLVLVNGNHVVATILYTGTNDGDWMGKPATKKKAGVLGLVAYDMTDDAKIKESWIVVDFSTVMGQLGLIPAIPDMAPRPVLDKGVDKPEIVVAKNDANEKNNVDAIAKGTDLMLKGDIKGMLANSTDDMVSSDQVDPADIKGKANVEKMYTQMMKMWSSPKFDDKARWGAGDYVVDIYSMEAQMMGKPVKAMGVNVFKFVGGKIAVAWGFGDKLAVMQQLGMIPGPAAAPGSSGAASSGAPGGKLGSAPAPAPGGKLGTAATPVAPAPGGKLSSSK